MGMIQAGVCTDLSWTQFDSMCSGMTWLTEQRIHLRHLWWHTREDDIRNVIDLDTLDVKPEIQ